MCPSVGDDDGAQEVVNFSWGEGSSFPVMGDGMGSDESAWWSVEKEFVANGVAAADR